MSELKENTKTEGTIFARFAKLENMIAMFSPDLPDVNKKTFMSDQISKLKKMNFRFGPDLRNEKT